MATAAKNRKISDNFVLATGMKVTIGKDFNKDILDLDKKLTEQDTDTMVQEMLNKKKRKKSRDIVPKKRVKESSSTETSISSLQPTTQISPQISINCCDDDIEWSDCDELEISRVLDQSMNQENNKPIGNLFD